jgi:PHP family Zn ribbon phosphoesterase
VEELADRDAVRDASLRVPFKSLIPLNEIIAAAGGKTAECRSVWDTYFRFIREFGNEHRILTEVPVGDLCALGPEKVGRGVERMRKGLVKIEPGYDGEYGTIRLFDGAEDDGKADAGNSVLL